MYANGHGRLPDILSERNADGVLTLTLNRPDALNAFTFAMYEELIGLLERLRHDAETRVVILTGAGRAFCAGHDLRGPPGAVGGRGARQGLLEQACDHAHRADPAADAVDPAAGDRRRERRRRRHRLRVRAGGRPVPRRPLGQVRQFDPQRGHRSRARHELDAAARRGHAAGGGDPADRAPGPADEAERIGLALRCVDDDGLAAEARKLADAVLANVPLGVWLTKQSLWLNQGVGSLEAACEIEARAVFMAQATEDAAEKRKAWLEKRAPQFRNV